MIGRWTNGLTARGWSPAVVSGYAALVGLFVWTLSQFYIPGKGFSYLIAFGGNLETQLLTKVRRLDPYVQKASDGYDAQYYVQIAMDPSLQNRELPSAVDSLPYRARRILFSATAYALGLGRPEWILQAYALQNPAAWLLLAAVLLHWFPPRDWDRFLRWAGVLFSFGMCVSVRHALIDGPGLLLVAVGALLLDRGRPWAATAAFALGGLGKETNLLGAAALAPAGADRRAWAGAVLRGALVAAPLALWLVYLAQAVGPVADAGARNFDWPLFAYFRKWREVIATLPEMTWPNFGALWSLLMLVALTTQFVLLVARPRWTEAWWRIGASYALLLLVLGDAVWEGYPGAASRVLLPMQVAFNVLAPAGRRWLPVLILGNLTLLSAPVALQAPIGEGYQLRGARELQYAPDGNVVEAVFDRAWHQTERDSNSYWRWTEGQAAADLVNPHRQPLRFRARFALTTVTARTVSVSLNGQELWSGAVSPVASVQVTLNDLVLAPGRNRLEFRSPEPPVQVQGDARSIAFCVHGLRFDLQGLAPAP
ncbi:MAG TPA: hypothetical protein VEB66_03260 [Opitutaceae bacterium]|nr:hypothetical protein [Opitutaceae bacterium]